MNNNSQSIHLRKEILVGIVKAFDSDNFEENIRLIPYKMRPKNADTPYRCCIYKERAILRDRTIAGLGFSIEEDYEITLLSEYVQKSLNRKNPDENPLTVLTTACIGCTPNRIYVTDLCQGCVARPCQGTCKFGAISIVNGKSIIDGTKCKNCKMCISACPYNAIVKVTVPCEESCPVGAIKKDENGFAKIDFESCITCGKCLAVCPFGAVHEKSQLIEVLKAMKEEKEVIALIAPAIVGQFPGNLYQLKTAMIKAGFTDVYEVAQGADITIKNEANEFEEKMSEGEPFMTTSCCAGYNQLVEKYLPEMKPFVSKTKTPMHYIAEKVKRDNPNAIKVFISPCSAKRKEVAENKNTDYMLNFEELGTIFIGRKIEIMTCEETEFDIESSKQGRNFANSGGVVESIKKRIEDTEKIKPCVINGLNKETVSQLKKYAKEKNCEGCNLIEVMCCESGCIGGNATINPTKIAKKILDNFTLSSSDL